MDFRGLDKVRVPATFQFLSNPSLFNVDFSLLNVGIKPVQYEFPGKPNQTFNRLPNQSSHQPHLPHRPCVLCTTKGFNTNHFTLNNRCGVAKLSSTEKPLTLQEFAQAALTGTLSTSVASKSYLTAPPRSAPKDTVKRPN